MSAYPEEEEGLAGFDCDDEEDVQGEGVVKAVQKGAIKVEWNGS